MKKLLSVALACTMLLGLSACNKKPVAAPAPAPAAVVVGPAPKLTPEALIRLRSEQAQRHDAFMARRAADAKIRHTSTPTPPTQ